MEGEENNESTDGAENGVNLHYDADPSSVRRVNCCTLDRPIVSLAV